MVGLIQTLTIDPFDGLRRDGTPSTANSVKDKWSGRFEATKMPCVVLDVRDSVPVILVWILIPGSAWPSVNHDAAASHGALIVYLLRRCLATVHSVPRWFICSLLILPLLLVL